MKTRTALIALATLAAGSAFAQVPAAGEGPFFANEAQIASTTSREAVRAEAAANLPAAGTHNGEAVAREKGAEQPSRAEVRQQTRDGIARGQLPAAGTRG